MQSILAITLPFFGLVLCGYLAAHSKILVESAIAGLNSFVLFFALPCMLFRFGMNTPVLDLLNPTVLLLYMLCALLIVGLTIALTWSKKIHLKDAAFGALVAAFPNSGFMGVPLLVAMLGPAAAGPTICSILVDLFVTSSLCIALAQAHEAKRSLDANHPHPMRTVWLNALRGPLSNPLPWAILLGILFSGFGLRLWGPIDMMVRMLGDAASPVALFTIGAVLWRARQHAHKRTPMHQVLPVALIKLLVHPLLVLVMCSFARRLGFPLSNVQILALTLVAALPSASNVSLLAERYGADNSRITRIIMTSTALAVVSFSLLALILNVSPA